MEGFIVLVYFIMLVWGVLNIILFFKIWSMTNDVKEIKNYIVNNNNSYSEPSTHSIKSTQAIDYEEKKQKVKLESVPSFKIGDEIRDKISTRHHVVEKIRPGEVYVKTGIFSNKHEWLPVTNFDLVKDPS